MPSHAGSSDGRSYNHVVSALSIPPPRSHHAVSLAGPLPGQTCLEFVQAGSPADSPPHGCCYSTRQYLTMLLVFAWSRYYSLSVVVGRAHRWDPITALERSSCDCSIEKYPDSVVIYLCGDYLFVGPNRLNVEARENNHSSICAETATLCLPSMRLIVFPAPPESLQVAEIAFRNFSTTSCPDRASLQDEF